MGGTRGAAGRGAGAAADCGRGVARIAAPRPGSPTALMDRAPLAPPPPTIVEGARIVRRLGVAIRPPGQSGVLGGCPPVAAAYVTCVVQYGRARSVSIANSRSSLPPTNASALNPR